MAREKFHEELDLLTDSVVEMGALARWMLEEGTASLIELDRERAAAVLARKDDLAALDDRIEEDALMLVARQQPVARDMRSIGAALKLITYINRLGRYGKDLAQITEQWRGDQHVAKLVNLPLMAETVVSMLDLVLTGYREKATIDLDRVLALEERVDAMRWSVFRECLTLMAENPANIEPCSYYMLIARYLERCGDNVCKMAEKTHYMVTGERLTIK